jgi:hypothetical protein
MHTTTTHSPMNSHRHLIAVLACTVGLAACPEPVPGVDAGPIDPTDPIEDAGTLGPVDGGQLDCPTVTAFMEGDPCDSEGQVCRSLLCIFPGPSCLELACVDGHWRNVIEAPDAGPDDAGVEPIRTVLEAPLFRGLPVDNLFLDPELTLASSAAFAFYNAAATDFVSAERFLSSELPLGTNGIRIRKTTNPAGVIALGAARVRAGAGIVQVDVGRPLSSNDLPDANVSFAGIFADGTEAALPLLAAGDVLVADGVRWQRYVASFDEGPVGWAYLVVSETHGTDLFLAAPILVALDASWSANSVDLASFRATRRALNDAEMRGLKRVAAADRERLHGREQIRGKEPFATHGPPRLMSSERVRAR